MSISDHYEARRDAGFLRSYDIEAARRQLGVSVALILVMVGAAVVLAFATPPATSFSVTPSGPAFQDHTTAVAQSLLDKQG